MGERARIATKKPGTKRENSVSKVQKKGFSQSISSPVDHILFLQRTIGNQAVQRLIKSGALQAKFETDAEYCIQRQEEVEEALQVKQVLGQTPEVTADLEARIQSMRDGGQLLQESVIKPIPGHLGSILQHKTDPIRTKTGYTTFPVPIPGKQKFIVQFYRRPDAIGGFALLRFKTSADDSPPVKIFIPAGHIFNPRILQERNNLITFSLDGGENPELYILLEAGQKIERHDAINPKNPGGPLLMDEEFSLKYVFADIGHPGGGVKYSWQESLPDEAIAPPPAGVWIQIPPPQHPGLMGNPPWKAMKGEYKGRTEYINYGQKATYYALNAGFIAGAKFLGSLAVYSIPYIGPLVMIGEVVTGRTIWGDKLNTEERVVFGLLTTIPIARALKGAAAGSRAELAAASELASSKGITSEKALTLIRGAKTVTAGEEAFVKSVTKRTLAGRAISEAEATRMSSLVDKAVKNGKGGRGLPAGKAPPKTKVWVSEGRKGRGKYVKVRTPSVEYVKRPLKQYDELIEVAVSERNKIPSAPKPKTGASAGGKSNISGWTTEPDAAETVNKVMRLAEKTGHKLRTHKLMDQGVPKRYYASHAEKKAAVLAPGKPIAVSAPMCPDCASFFQALAKYTKTPIAIAEPNAVRIFKPDGSIMFIPR